MPRKDFELISQFSYLGNEILYIRLLKKMEGLEASLPSLRQNLRSILKATFLVKGEKSSRLGIRGPGLAIYSMCNLAGHCFWDSVYSAVKWG